MAAMDRLRRDLCRDGVTKQVAEKYTEGLRRLIFWCWRAMALLAELGYHEALGLSEDQFYDAVLKGDSQSSTIFRKAVLGYRDDYANGTGFYSEAAE